MKLTTKKVTSSSRTTIASYLRQSSAQDYYGQKGLIDITLLEAEIA